MYNQDIKNRFQSYPFTLQSVTQTNRNIVASIYDIRLSVILPYRGAWIGSGKWFLITLQSISNGVLTFSINDNVNQKKYNFSYSQQGFKSEENLIDTANSYIDCDFTALSITKQVNLQLSTACLLLSCKGGSISLKCGKVLQQGDPNSQIQNQTILNTLNFNNGYNTKVDIDDNNLIFTCSAGQGAGIKRGYKHWQQFNVPPYDTMTQDQIKLLNVGALSINGKVGDVTIDSGASVSMVTQFNDQQITLKLDLVGVE